MKYDAKGNMVENQVIVVQEKTGNTKTLYKYNKGNKIEEKDFDSEGNPMSKQTFVYDMHGNMTEEDNYGTEGTEYTSPKKKIYTYNSQNKKATEEIYNDKGKMWLKRSYEYDAKGNMVKETKWVKEYEKENTSASTYEYDTNGNCTGSNGKPEAKFEYDAQGNWIKCTSLQNGKPVLVTERQIEYFK